MFDPTSRIQAAQLHGNDLHHAARHVTHHSADHALHRRTADTTATPVAGRAAHRAGASRRLAHLLGGLGARHRVGRLTHRSA